MQYFPKEKQNTQNWSGGTTTELYLYPPNGNYKKRDFLIRLSTAVCKDEKSSFTKLPETERILMVLNGEVLLSYEDGRSVKLYPGEQDTFDGGKETISHGKCQDFNLMLKGNAKGSLEYISLSADERSSLVFDASGFGIYLLNGKLKVSSEQKIQTMQVGDFLLLGMEMDKMVMEEEREIELLAMEPSIFVMAKLYI